MGLKLFVSTAYDGHLKNLIFYFIFKSFKVLPYLPNSCFLTLFFLFFMPLSNLAWAFILVDVRLLNRTVAWDFQGLFMPPGPSFTPWNIFNFFLCHVSRVSKPGKGENDRYLDDLCLMFLIKSQAWTCLGWFLNVRVSDVFLLFTKPGKCSLAVFCNPESVHFPDCKMQQVFIFQISKPGKWEKKFVNNSTKL